MTTIKELKQEFYNLTGVDTKFKDVISYAHEHSLIEELTPSEAPLTARNKQFWINAVAIARLVIQKSEADLEVSAETVSPQPQQEGNDTSPIDNIFTAPNGHEFTVGFVLEVLRSAGYSAWVHHEHEILIDTLPGFILVHGTYVILSSRALVDSGVGKLVQSSADNSLTAKILSATRLSLWTFDEAKKEYEWLNSYLTLEDVCKSIQTYGHDISTMDLRKERYNCLTDKWTCTKHLDIHRVMGKYSNVENNQERIPQSLG